MQNNQADTVLMMRAKPGTGDTLFKLTHALHSTGDPDGRVEWALCRADDAPDTLWAFEFHKDEALLTRHFANPEIDQNHDDMIELLAEIALRWRSTDSRPAQTRGAEAKGA